MKFETFRSDSRPRRKYGGKKLTPAVREENDIQVQISRFSICTATV